MSYLSLERVYEHLCILQEGKEGQVANLCWAPVHYLTVINTVIKCSRVVDRKDSVRYEKCDTDYVDDYV